LFEFLFKYRPLVFERGELVLGFPWWALAAGIAALALLVPTLLRYRRVGGDATRLDRIVLSTVRTAALAIVLFCLFRPVLLISTVVPQRNFIAVLLDDSRSMRVTDVDGRARAELIVELFGGEVQAEESQGEESLAGGEEADTSATGDAAGDVAAGPGPQAAGSGAIREALEERFRVRYYRFSSDAARVSSASELRFSGGRTDLASALDRAQQELAGLPLSGLVLVTDGADNSGESMTDALLALQAAAVPVYTVGLGSERISPDIEIQRVEVPRSVLVGTTLVADVIVSHAGYGGRRVQLDVEDAGRIIGSEVFDLPADGELPVRVQFQAEESGPRRVAFRVRPEEGEAVTANNVRQALIEVRDQRQKILYFEGEPRFEIKFLRRAIKEDPNLQLVVLLRTADEKFLRLGVDDGEELASGFPATREELFSYAGLVLGSVEASFFTHDQLQMMADFVSQRGGGLLLLGGRAAFAEGGYAGTPLADALPVVLEAAAPGNQVVEVSVELTPAGRRHPALRVADGDDESAERWSMLPPLTSANLLSELKPGAVTLLSGSTVPDGDSRVVLAHQRFGRGRAVVFPVQDSWLWQMHADIPVDDPTHETLWRQLLRWLVTDVPGRVRVQSSEESIDPGDPLVLTAEVEDERYLRVNGLRPTVRITDPTGLDVDVPMEWTVDQDGEYTAQYRPDQTGLYQVRVELPGDSTLAAGDRPAGTSYFHSGPTEREQFGAGMRRGLLERIADESGGLFYTFDEVEQLPEDIRYTETGNTVIERRELWDMPVLFLLLLGLVGGEWGYRRWRRLT